MRKAYLGGEIGGHEKKVNDALFPLPLLYNDARKWTSALFPFIGLNKQAPGYSFDIFSIHNDICSVAYSPKKTTYYVLLVFCEKEE